MKNSIVTYQDTIKLWVVTIDEDYEERERHYFRTEEKAKHYFEKIKEEWKSSKHTDNYKEWKDIQAHREYVWTASNSNRKCSRLEVIRCFEKEITFE